MSIDATNSTPGVVLAYAVEDRSLVEQLETMPAGPQLAVLVFATDPAGLDPYAQVAFVQACQRLLNMVTARQDAGVVAFAAANPRDTVYWVDGSEHALTDARALELQLALAWSEGHTRTRIHTARTLATRLPACEQAVASGGVQPLVTRAIAEGAETLTASIDEAIAIALQTKSIPVEMDALREVRRYQLTETEQQRIAMRDRSCRMLDCDAPAYRCECDHAHPYNAGGATSTANLGLVCKKHHQHKTHAGWTITDSADDGSCTWTSPHGRTYRHEPEPVLPVAPPTIDPANDPPPF